MAKASNGQIFISDYRVRVHQREAIAYTKTDEFKQEMKSRSNIERIIAGVVRYNGAREAEAYGLAQADYQVKMAAMAYNRSTELTPKSQTLGRVVAGERAQTEGQHRRSARSSATRIRVAKRTLTAN